MSLTPTEIEELRIAIAEEMGWRVEVDDDQFWRATDSKGNRNSSLWCSQDAAIRDLPDYTTSIDAIREAAMERFKYDDATKFCFNLSDLAQNKPFNIPPEESVWTWQLSALDWCIAFARTAKIWRFK